MRTLHRLRRVQTISARKIREAFGDMLRHDGCDVAATARAVEHATRTLRHDDALDAINVALRGHGVESIGLPEANPDWYTDRGVRHCPAYSYVNQGDPYALTVFRDHKAGAWIVACWGDVVERAERRRSR